MRSIDIWMGQDVLVTGRDKDEVLSTLRQKLTAASDLNGVQIDTNYKESRKIVTKESWDKEYPDDLAEGPYGVEINLNGGGEVQWFASKDEVINFFLQCVAEQGEHWD